VTRWFEIEDDYTPDEDDVPVIEPKDHWVEFGKWCTVKAEYFCKQGTVSYFEVELKRYSGCSDPQFGFCTSKFEKQTFGRFGASHGVGDDEDSWGVDGERCMLWGGDSCPEPSRFERLYEWKESDVIGFVCDMKSEAVHNAVASDSMGVVEAKRYAHIYVFINGKPMNCKKDNRDGLAFMIPIPDQENSTHGANKTNEFRLWPAFSARNMRLGYNFGPQFRYQTEIKSKLSKSTGISSHISCLYFSGEGMEKSTSYTFQLPLVNLKPKGSGEFSESELWKQVMGQTPPSIFRLQTDLTISELSQAVNMLLIKSQLDAVQTASSLLVLRDRVQVLKNTVEKQEKELDKTKSLDLIEALIDVPFIGMLTISFALPRRNKIQIIFKLFPFIIFAVQWILLVTVGNFSLSKYNNAGGKWCLNNATLESRALMSAIAALILAKNAQRLVGLLESTNDESENNGDDLHKDESSEADLIECTSDDLQTDEKSKTQPAMAKKTQLNLKGLAKLEKLISNTDGAPRMIIFFIIDLGMEICFASAVLLVNLFIVFVAGEPLDMVLNCLALEFIADLDNQMKEYLFRSWTEKDALLSSFENEMTKQLDKDRWWDAFVLRWVGGDEPKWWFTAITIFLALIGFLFSFLFAPLATLVMIGFGPACKPGELK
jgi:hypothetical protein